MTHGKPKYEYEVDLGLQQLWVMLEDAVRNRDYESTFELINKISLYLDEVREELVIE